MLNYILMNSQIASGERGGVVVEHRTPNREVLGPDA